MKPWTILLGLISHGLLAQSDLMEGEYFIDSDPGFGMAIPITFSSSPNIDLIELIDITGLSVGVHTMGVRIKDENDLWSLPSYTSFFVRLSSLNSVSNITQAEYFFDTDPGVGAATPISISSSPTLDLNETISTSGLDFGHHLLHLRIQNEFGEWSLGETIQVLVDHTVEITQMEYFYDTDPGINSAINVPITPSTNLLDMMEVLTTTGLALGNHILGLRLGEANDVFGVTEYISLDVCDGAIANFSINQGCAGESTAFNDQSLNVLGGDTYSWDFDGDLTEDDNTEGSTNFSYPASGLVTATLTIDRLGCTSTHNTTIDIDEPTNALAGVDVIACSDQQVVLSGNLTGSATTGTWTSMGDGVFDDLTNLGATYAPGPTDLINGGTQLTLTPDNPLDCNAVNDDQLTLSIDILPTVNAGLDQTICPNESVNLDGNTSAPTASWSTSGTGSFTDPSALTTSYTPSSNDMLDGSVELSLTAAAIGVCQAPISTMIVTIDPTFDLSRNNFQVSVGDTLQFDPAIGSGVSVGEMNDVRIITQSTKGVSSVLPTGAVSYIPSDGTINADSVQIELCNSCDSCDRGYFLFDILNSPPLIQIPQETAPPRKTVIVDLITSVTDPNDNIDFSSLIILAAPSSGATASFDGTNLVVDYTDLFFTGLDELTIQVCDHSGECQTEIVNIFITETDINVFNAVSPNNDGIQDYLRIQNIGFFPGNTVTIYNRWGDRVFEVQGYDNIDVIFQGFANHNSNEELIDGTYFYVIDKKNGDKPKTGFLEIRR